MRLEIRLDEQTACDLVPVCVPPNPTLVFWTSGYSGDTRAGVETVKRSQMDLACVKSNR